MEGLERGQLCRYTYYDGGTKVIELVEFKYIGQTGKAIVCPPGEPDTQSSFAVDPNQLEPCAVNIGDVYDFNGQQVRVLAYTSSDEVRVETRFCDQFIVHESDLEEL